MLSLIRSKSFLAGFIVGWIFVVAANIYTANSGYESGSNDNGIVLMEEFDSYTEIGWPFRFHRSGTILHLDDVLWRGLIADIIIAIGISTAVGIVFHIVFAAQAKRLDSKGVN